MTRRVFQLRVTLEDVAPPVWRQVLVPAAYTLDRVHRVIQFAMGWQDCHLHSFEIDGEQYGEPDPGGELPMHDEMEYRLDDVTGPGCRFGYVYDFGDWWEHEVVVEDVLAADPRVRYPVCVTGERGCPPEDVGGPEGYAEFVAALGDTRHPRHAAMGEWIGRVYDPEDFDPDRATTLLRRLT
ncbi:plasmid pRiA4b ORF-3 family protein [Planosporangium sp. 12N6]|uniref:plasmid pRiA4b ORF-3 family protein n=1 Tax=Planosporangium spinosum TaxID=3402278 RepID=UPI003CE809DA